MANFKVRTKGNADPRGKPKVYFTCHPEDFTRSFDKICDDIFRTHDCAVYYTESMESDISESHIDTDLGSMNLFVVPVTHRLLSQPNRAMDSDIAYAKVKHIPILPVMLEPGLDDIYSRPDRFGELQYLDPYSADTTAIGYADKLKKYLESVLISDETAKRVREAFDAYIFLSYRKKDRAYANTLMRLIHSRREFRDIAVWYDEFLTPGESFRANIEKMLEDSCLFALLVTPNLLEEPDGVPNYVMRVEYPEAVRKSMEILPFEMESTDKAVLRSKFADIPACVDPSDADIFRQALLASLGRAAVTHDSRSPEHTFLIGLAYLDGIDVEVDRRRALTLITQAAEQELPEAIEKLYNMYSEGAGVRLDYREAVIWAERLCAYYERAFGKRSPQTLTVLGNLAYTYSMLGEHEKALDIQQKVYPLLCKVLGKDHPDTLLALGNLASSYGELGDYENALKLKKKIYTQSCKILGEEHPDTLTALGNLAFTYGDTGNFQKELELEEKAYSLMCKTLGEEHPDTLLALHNLASTYDALGNYKKALESKEKVYSMRLRVIGEEHPDTLSSLGNLALSYGTGGDYRKEAELEEKVYALRCRILGEEHPDTVTCLCNLASTYGNLGEHEKALPLKEKAYSLRCKTFGEEHPDTLIALGNLAMTYGDLGDKEKEAKLEEKVYALKLRVLGEAHPSTINTLGNLSMTYTELGEYQKALETGERAYTLLSDTLGEKHPRTLILLGNLALAYSESGDCKKALELFYTEHTLLCEVYGEEHPSTQAILKRINAILGKCGI